MAPLLSKRKRPATPASRPPRKAQRSASPESESDTQQDLQRLLQKHFENRFKPLHDPAPKLPAVTVHEQSGLDSDFEGFQEEEDEDEDGDGDGDEVEDDEEKGVEVIEINAIQNPTALSKAEKRAFMVRAGEIRFREKSSLIT